MRLAAGDQPLADAGAAGHDLDEAGRKGREHLHELQRRDAGLLMRLDDDRIAGGKRRRRLPAQEHERIVERQHDDDGARAAP